MLSPRRVEPSIVPGKEKVDVWGYPGVETSIVPGEEKVDVWGYPGVETSIVPGEAVVPVPAPREVLDFSGTWTLT